MFYLVLSLTAIIVAIALLPDTKPSFGFDVDLSQRRKVNISNSFSGPLLANSLLSRADKLFQHEILGPQSFAVWKGNIYTGLADGRIVRILPDSFETVTLIDPHDHGLIQCAKRYNLLECGRPRGLVFHSNGTLYMVDLHFGLFSINVTTGENVLIKRREDLDDAIFLNDLTVYEKDNGYAVFYMTDVSHRWESQDAVMIMTEQEQTGRLISYDTENGAVRVEVDNLPAPYGVALTDNREAILIASFTDCLIYKYTFSGKNAAKLEVLIENLPGEAENIYRSANPYRETYWIGLFTGRNVHNPSRIDKYSSKNGYLLRFLLRIQRSIGFLLQSFAIFSQNELLMDLGFVVRTMQLTSPLVCDYGMALEIDANTGEIVNSLHSPDGTVCALSGVLERESKAQNVRTFYLGSAFNSYLGKLSLPKGVFRNYDTDTYA